jgi:mannose/cellobiose epimerase-like protein (N-acyl-D-glucosamine 2-epimerase family)
MNPRGGFFDLDDQGKPMSSGQSHAELSLRHIHVTTRMIHCFAIAYLLGRPGADVIIEHGMDFLWNRHRDMRNGGYFWSVGDDGPGEDSKQAYGHAFVLLAASSAKVAGHPDADRLLTDISTVLLERFWGPNVCCFFREFHFGLALP